MTIFVTTVVLLFPTQLPAPIQLQQLHAKMDIISAILLLALHVLQFLLAGSIVKVNQ
jgi:hypothetical protein